MRLITPGRGTHYGASEREQAARDAGKAAMAPECLITPACPQRNWSRSTTPIAPRAGTPAGCWSSTAWLMRWLAVAVDELRTLLRPLLARRLTPAERRAVASEVRQLADEQERLAEADQHVGHIVRRAAEDAAPRRAAKGHGRALYSLGRVHRTQRLAAHRAGALARSGRAGPTGCAAIGQRGLAPTLRGGPGLASVAPNGPAWRDAATGDRPRPAMVLRLQSGRWGATIRDGAIIASMP